MIKIALPVTTDNNIDTHFGHCESFGVYTISDNNEVIGFKRVESPQGCGCKSNIAAVLASDGVSVMLAGGIGDGAINVLKSNGVEVIRGCTGNAGEVVEMYIKGIVKDSGSSCSQHGAQHGQGHSCSHN